MPRHLRLYAPNGIFHVTARTQGCQHWFDEPIRDFICRALGSGLRRTDAKLRGCVIMSNHLHLLVQQGNLPLCALMQPFLCRVALAVQRKYELSGHVFGGRFWESLCVDPRYLAALLNYIHNNPVRADLCASACDWRWSSFAAYHGTRCEMLPFVEPFDGIAHVFARGIPITSAEPEPLWRRRPRIDLRDLLLMTLRRLTNGDMDLETLLDMRGRAASKLRRELIVVAARAGYRGVLIARSLRVSESTVSSVAIANRLPRSRI